MNDINPAGAQQMDNGIQKGLVITIKATNKRPNPTSTVNRLSCRTISKMTMRKNSVNLRLNFAHLLDLLRLELYCYITF